MGRPPLGDKKRKPLMALVDPETIEALDEYAEAKRISRGRAIDTAAKLLKKSKRRP
jgi:hypothetical protein